jgi:hypothetical protein
MEEYPKKDDRLEAYPTAGKTNRDTGSHTSNPSRVLLCIAAYSQCLPYSSSSSPTSRRSSQSAPRILRVEEVTVASCKWDRHLACQGREKQCHVQTCFFELRANVQRDLSMVVFLEPDVQWIVSNRHGSVSLLRVHSRHPGGYPKLESSTLFYPAFEPLTERHAFHPAYSTSHCNIDAHDSVSRLLDLFAVLIIFRQLTHSGLQHSQDPAFGVQDRARLDA